MYLCKTCGWLFSSKYCPRCGTLNSAESSDVTISSYGIEFNTETDEDKEAEARKNLWDAMHASFLNKNKCHECATLLLSYAPEDYYANFAEVVLLDDEGVLESFLWQSLSTDIEKYADAVLYYVCWHMTKKLYPAVRRYLDRANLKDSAKYEVLIEKYATNETKEKLDDTESLNRKTEAEEERKMDGEKTDFPQNGSKGLEFQNKGNGYSVVGIGNCTDKDIIIPAEHNGGKVISIGEEAFEYCDSVTSVTIPDSVTSIGNSAFDTCRSLKSVFIPDSVTHIGHSAFAGCISLTSIAIPQSVSTIEGATFYGCKSLMSITIPEGVTSICENAFLDCWKLVEIYNLSYLYIKPRSEDNGRVAYYAKHVYNYNGKKDNFVTTEDGYIFYKYGYDYYLMGYDGNEKDIVLPNGINGNSYEIYMYAFFNCISLTSVTIPDFVTSIGEHAFSLCRSLMSITIPKSIISIEANAFEFCWKLLEVYNLSSLKIKPGEESNGQVAYFAKQVYNDANKRNNFVITKDGYIFYRYRNDNYLIGYNGGESKLILPDTIDGRKYDIYMYAFVDCLSVTSVVIPNSMSSIGSHAFRDCVSLKSVVIPTSVTTIYDGAFAGCTSLTSIAIPDSVARIGYDAFSGCTALTSIIIPNSVTTIEMSTFEGCESLLSVVIPDNVTSIDSSAFEGCNSLMSVTIPRSVTSIEERAFIDCDSLTDVYYSGFEGEWLLISIECGNYSLEDATIHYEWEK